MQLCSEANSFQAIVRERTKVAQLLVHDTHDALLQPSHDFLESGLYADLDLLANFIDNHDVARVATFCAADALRISNALMLIFMWRGIPVVYSGTEQGLAGDHNHNRDSLWRTGFP